MSKQQKIVLVVSILAALVSFLDGSIVNVALPAINRSLGGGLSAQQWIVDAYALTLGALILLAGSLSDLLGRKRILQLGLIGFGIASILCAIAPNSTLLIIFRALQGVAGALLVPSSLALIISTFKGKAQGKAIGTWTAWTGISFIIGPLLGGFLVDEASWRWIFAINILPIAITMYLLNKVEVTKNDTKNVRIDYTGASLGALGLASSVFALIEQPHYGWSDPLIYLTLGVGLLILLTFLVYEKRSESAMLPLSLFKNRNFAAGNIATFAVYAGLGASTFLIVLFLQQVSGYSALNSGLALLPVTIIMFFVSPRTGALAGKYGPRFFMGVGPLIAAIGFLLMTRLESNFDYLTQLLPAVAIFGLGLSITVSPLTAAILGDVPESQAGIASAVNNAVSRVAGLIAVAGVGAVVAAQFGHYVSVCLPDVSSQAVNTAKQASLVTTPPRPYQNDAYFKSSLTYASVKGFHAGLDTIAGLMIAGGLISLAGIRNPAKK